MQNVYEINCNPERSDVYNICNIYRVLFDYLIENDNCQRTL